MSMKPKLMRLLPPERRAELNQRLSTEQTSYTDLAAELREQGLDVNGDHVRNYAIFMGLAKRRSLRATKIESLLSPEHAKEYEALLADRRTTAKTASAWLTDRGYDIGARSLATHRRRFLDTLDRVRHSAQIAGAIVDIAREKGQIVIGDAMLTRCEQVLFEQLMRLQEDEEIDSKTLSELCKSVSSAMGSRKTMEAIRSEFEEQKRKAARAAEDAVKRGATGQEVVDRVKEILGV